MRLHIGTFWTHALDDEDHDLYLEVEQLAFLVIITTEQGSQEMPAKVYLDTYPHHRLALHESLMALFR